MDPWPIVTLAVSVALLVALTRLRRLKRTVEIARGAVGARSDPEIEHAAIRQRERVERLERELAGERRDHEALTDLFELGFVDLDADLRVVQANTAAHAFLDRAPGSLLGRDTIEAFLDTQVESIAKTALRLGSAAGEIRLGGADGLIVIVRARRSAAGGIWLVLEDVTELRRLQQIRKEFIDNLSHELRTPLTTVSLLAETLAREAIAAGDGVPAKMRDRIAKIEVETGHLVQMVTVLLDLSRIESGGTLALIEEVDLEHLARASIDRLHLFADRQGVTLRVDAGAVPTVRGDEARLGQVFINLLHNAVKFSPNGGDVTVTVRAVGSEVVASISDPGVGIPKADQSRVFERFYKVDRARVRGEAGGTGLGLSIARHVVEQHGGRIWVESKEGHGSTFSFAIPTAPGAG
ncbi:MAG: hypothetical protein H0V74_04140 [Chloroflexi bacterium]|nr:hypothetical protein [Chloroflexota bacterium]